MSWNEKSTLKILSSTAIRYTKRSFFTEENHITIPFDEIIKPI
ncbi:MAG: hypothetical protein QM493_11985 [Sulfurovum sp.]